MADIQQADVLGNYLSNYNAAMQQKQQQADRQFQQQRMQVQDQRAEQQFQWTKEQHDQIAAADAASKELRLLKPGDKAGFDAAVQRLVSQGYMKPEDAAKLNYTMLPQLQEQDKQWQELQSFRTDQRYKNAQIANINSEIAARGKAAGGGGIAQTAAQRAQLAQALGIDPQSDAGKRYILTGQMPNGLTPSDREAVRDSDQKVLATGQGLDMLKQARVLSDRANQGPGMNAIAQVASLWGDKTAIDTIDFDNLLQSQVLPQLKVIFGGAPTEGERAILLELQGSSRLGREARNRILDRAITMADARLKFYNNQASEIRGGTYYNPGKGPVPSEQIAPSTQTQKAPAPQSLNGWKIEVAK